MYIAENEKQVNTNEIPAENLFATLLAEYEPVVPHKGQFLAGEIVQIEDNMILANVDAKRTAVVPPQDLARLDEADLEALEVGDEVTLYVLHTPIGDEDLLVSLNRGLELRDWENAGDYMADEEVVELEVIGHNKGGLLVAFGHLRGFVPTSHVPSLRRLQNRRELASLKEDMVGEELPLKVIEVDPQRRRLILSATKAQTEVKAQRLLELKLKEHEAIKGTVTNLVKFGAFVDLDGVEGLIHLSELAWTHVRQPADVLAAGDEVEVLIQAVDLEQERISLSRKALLPSPWDSFMARYEIGELIEGTVTNVTDFGAFVSLADGIEGLIHVSEMHGGRDLEPKDLLSRGDQVLVRILRLEPERERIGLSQRQVSQWEETEWIFQQQQEAEAVAA
ncbi:MAG: S1 RNA-binding domain-containing protein [Anaerolineales bacterium]|nr:S1 RNA-binding domain-containing protein [Anaerolineales bacterium]